VLLLLLLLLLVLLLVLLVWLVRLLVGGWAWMKATLFTLMATLPPMRIQARRLMSVLSLHTSAKSYLTLQWKDNGNQDSQD
jgi:hypothetical protein